MVPEPWGRRGRDLPSSHQPSPEEGPSEQGLGISVNNGSPLPGEGPVLYRLGGKATKERLVGVG